MNEVSVVRRSLLIEISVDRPPVNALSTKTLDALAAAFRGVAEDCRCVVLKGSGAGFTAGADLKESAGLDVGGQLARRQSFIRAVTALAEIPVPVIASLHGYVIGAGLALAALCDIRIAADDVVFALPEIDVGGLTAATALLPRIGVSSGGLREMLFTGDRYLASDAVAFSLADRLVARSELEVETERIASRILSKERSALISVKRGLARTELGNDWKQKYELLENGDD